MARNNPTLAQLAENHFKDSRRFKNILKPPHGWFENKLKHGKCLVMLDGLDEVANQADRKNVSAWIELQIAAYPNTLFFLSARPEGYKEAPVTVALPLKVLPLEWPSIKEVIQKWHAERAEVSSTETRDHDINRQIAEAQGQDLIRRLHIHASLIELAANPLLLSMIIVVHSSSNTLPEKRAELYDRICKLLLGRWRERPSSLTPDQKQIGRAHV